MQLCSVWKVLTMEVLDVILLFEKVFFLKKGIKNSSHQTLTVWTPKDFNPQAYFSTGIPFQRYKTQKTSFYGVQKLVLYNTISIGVCWEDLQRKET